ncbi:MAG: hypothetical protein LBV47_03195 [Bacteroidales bacterium]|jgi:cell fate regulator YaaT (PSP1 superfamily)|nr:hypothetical protein [Bacteroidales bacterium]
MEKINTIERGVCCSGLGSCAKLHVTDWMGDIKSIGTTGDIIEVRFKNKRKDYYHNVDNLKLNPGDLVAVEANTGHDIGIVTLTSDLVHEQMKKHKFTLVNGELRKVYRKAKQTDIEKWKEAIALEHQTMIQSRQIVADMNLNMKIGDIEYQGDRTKAIFYYIADERVDFRQLIKVLAKTFQIRIEMKQIGARQEAGCIGGIGPCGRELCCASWMSNFVSVSTNAARYQKISLNPLKLAGQCGKLKCCLNFEVDAYIDAQKDFPPTHFPLEIDNEIYIFSKADVFNRTYCYSLKGNESSGMIEIPVETVRKIQQMNEAGKKPGKTIITQTDTHKNNVDNFYNMAGQEDMNRFDKQARKYRKKKRYHNQVKQHHNK